MEAVNKTWHTAADTFRNELHAFENHRSEYQRHQQQHGEEPVSGVQGKGTVTDPYDAGNRDVQPGAPKDEKNTAVVPEALTSVPVPPSQASHSKPVDQSSKWVPGQQDTDYEQRISSGKGSYDHRPLEQRTRKSLSSSSDAQQSQGQTDSAKPLSAGVGVGGRGSQQAAQKATGSSASGTGTGASAYDQTEDEIQRDSARAFSHSSQDQVPAAQSGGAAQHAKEAYRGPSVSGIDDKTKAKFESEAQKARQQFQKDAPEPPSGGAGASSGSGAGAGAKSDSTGDKAQQKDSKPSATPGAESGQEGGQKNLKEQATDKMQSASSEAKEAAQNAQKEAKQSVSGAADKARQSVQKDSSADGADSSAAAAAAAGGADEATTKPAAVQRGVSKEALQGPQGPPPREKYEFEKNLDEKAGGKAAGSKSMAEGGKDNAKDAAQKAQKRHSGHSSQGSQSSHHNPFATIKDKVGKVLHHNDK